MTFKITLKGPRCYSATITGAGTQERLRITGLKFMVMKFFVAFRLNVSYIELLDNIGDF